MSQLPPGKYYWPGPESHEAYTNKSYTQNQSFTPNYHIPNHQNITGSECHCSEPINQKSTCGCGTQHTKKYPI